MKFFYFVLVIALSIQTILKAQQTQSAHVGPAGVSTTRPNPNYIPPTAQNQKPAAQVAPPAKVNPKPTTQNQKATVQIVPPAKEIKSTVQNSSTVQPQSTIKPQTGSRISTENDMEHSSNRSKSQQLTNSSFPINNDFIGTFYDPYGQITVSFSLKSNRYFGVFANSAGQSWDFQGELVNNYTLSGPDGNGKFKTSIYGNTLVFLTNSGQKYTLYRNGSAELQTVLATPKTCSCCHGSRKSIFMCGACTGSGHISERLTRSVNKQVPDYTGRCCETRLESESYYESRVCSSCNGVGYNKCNCCYGTGRK